MRALWMSLPIWLATGAALSAQQPAPPQPQTEAALDQVLSNWEKTMTGVRSLVADCERTTVDKTFQTKEVFEGTVKFLKSPVATQPSQASLELKKKGNPNIYEKFIYTGTFLYEFSPGDKVIRAHQLPAPKPGQVADDNFLSFLFGMKAAEAKARFQLALSQDKNYYYVAITPRQNADKADFIQARLTLVATSFLPRELWIQQPNGNDVFWSFPRVQNGVPIPANEFGQPAIPPGWQRIVVPMDAGPRVTRNSPE